MLWVFFGAAAFWLALYWLAMKQSEIRYCAPVVYTMDSDELAALTHVAEAAYRQSRETEPDWRMRLSHRLAAVVTTLDLDKDSLRFHQGSGVDAFSVVTLDRTRMLVGIRGTQGLFDWVINAMTWLRRVPGGFGHRGGSLAAQQLYGPLGLRKRMKEFPAARVLVAGHSQGCLVASGLMVLAEDDLDHVFDAAQGITGALLVEAPRYASWDLARRLHLRIGHRVLRISYCRDVVTMLPLRIMGFAHFADDQYYDRFGNLNRAVTPAYRVFDRGVALLSDLSHCRFNLLSYHSCRTVCQMVRRDLERFMQ